jgi:hypothetical protein
MQPAIAGAAWAPQHQQASKALLLHPECVNVGAAFAPNRLMWHVSSQRPFASYPTQQQGKAKRTAMQSERRKIQFRTFQLAS